MADSIEEFEKRLEVLENRVFGSSNKDAHYPKESCSLQCTDTLMNVQTSLNKAVGGKKKINKIYGKLPELQRCLDPAQADEMTLSDAAKTEIILAEEEMLLQQAARLETLKQQLEQETLDSQHIKDCSNGSGKLNDLCQLQIQQQDQAGQLSEGVKNLLATYNTIITLLSKQFVKWDEAITRLELEQQKRKIKS